MHARPGGHLHTYTVAVCMLFGEICTGAGTPALVGSVHAHHAQWQVPMHAQCGRPHNCCPALRQLGTRSTHVAVPTSRKTGSKAARRGLLPLEVWRSEDGRSGTEQLLVLVPVNFR
jgi:hypothetical protein